MSSGDDGGAGAPAEMPVVDPRGEPAAAEAAAGADARQPGRAVGRVGEGAPSNVVVEGGSGGAPPTQAVTTPVAATGSSGGQTGEALGCSSAVAAGGIGGMLPASPFHAPCSTSSGVSMIPQRSVPADFREASSGGPGQEPALSSPFSSGDAGLGISDGPAPGGRSGGLAPGDPARLGPANAHKRAISATARQGFQYLPFIPQAEGSAGGQQRGGLPAPATGITRTRSAPMPPRPPEPEPKGQEFGQGRQGESKDGEEKQSGRYANVLCGGSADIGQRRTMEDYFIAGRAGECGAGAESQIEAFVGVFDGHNGPEAAQFASENFMPFLAEACAQGSGIAPALRAVFQRCEADLYAAWRGGSFGESGTTALVCVLTSDGHLRVANAGDCRAVLSRAGRAEALTQDHKPGCQAERGRIIAAGGYLDDDDYLNGEIGVSRCIGDFHLGAIKKPDDGSGALIPDPDLYNVEVTSECEFVILGSDGLWDVLSNQRAVDLARGELDESRSAEKAAKKLVFEAKCKDGRDNITAALMALCPLPFPARKSARRQFVNSRLRLNSRSLMDLKQALQSAEGAPPAGPF
ncbi:unnamed protein product [Ostreobium quekettii]|uniref:PPM-type phosphatase domain-containing protein n=1 Tax=Ostreobium quekettii TaxID=121088 RepID=A0A8S1IT67_9CHLO|nr:unnamed protein product [Ostreobium quekettii]|eukprot:evm.model.scf_183.10 EVM.evm.TU.scf_183.10   scf_183:107141-108874(+)